jgi:hypothetical protein
VTELDRLEYESSRQVDDEARSLLVQRAHRYRTECGCAMGAVFMTGAMVAFAVHVVMEGRFTLGHLVVQFLTGVLFVFACSVVGKLAGIGIGRLRYVTLRRRIRRLYGSEVTS